MNGKGLRKMLGRWLPAILAVACSACLGGSGSSGFDIRAENAAIERTLAEGGCETVDGLEICLAGELPAPSPTPTAPSPSPTPTSPPSPTPRPPGSPTPPPSPSPTSSPTSTPSPPPGPTGPPVVAVVPPAELDTIICRAEEPGTCVVPFTFFVAGAPEESTPTVLYRVDAEGSWTVAPVPGPAAEAGTFTTDLLVPADAARIQVAVLLLPEALAAGELESLRESGARQAFVVEISGPALAL